MSRVFSLPFREIGESEGGGFESRPHDFEPWLSQTNEFKIDTCHIPSLAFGIIRIRQGLVGSVSG